MENATATTIVIIKNRATGAVLDHCQGEWIQAKDQDETHSNHQWHRLPLADGYVAYRNVGTGQLLEHYNGGSIEAFHAVQTSVHQQWKEVATNSPDNFVGIVNRGTGKALDHYYEKEIQAYNGDVTNHHHQWIRQHYYIRVCLLQVTTPSEGFAFIKDWLTQTSFHDDSEFTVPYMSQPVKRRKLDVLLPWIRDDKHGGGNGIRESLEQYFDIADVMGPDVEMARAVAKRMVASIPGYPGDE